MCLTAEEGAWSSHIYAAEALRKREINSERQAHTIGRREKIASFTSKGIEFCTGTRENLHLFRRFRHSRHPPHLLAGFPPIWRSDPDTIPSPEPLPVNTPPRPTRRKTPLVSRLPLPSPCPYGRRCVGVPVSGTQIEESRWSSAGTKERRERCFGSLATMDAAYLQVRQDGETNLMRAGACRRRLETCQRHVFLPKQFVGAAARAEEGVEWAGCRGETPSRPLRGDHMRHSCDGTHAAVSTEPGGGCLARSSTRKCARHSPSPLTTPPTSHHLAGKRGACPHSGPRICSRCAARRSSRVPGALAAQVPRDRGEEGEGEHEEHGHNSAHRLQQERAGGRRRGVGGDEPLR